MGSKWEEVEVVGLLIRWWHYQVELPRIHAYVVGCGKEVGKLICLMAWVFTWQSCAEKWAVQQEGRFPSLPSVCCSIDPPQGMDTLPLTTSHYRDHHLILHSHEILFVLSTRDKEIISSSGVKSAIGQIQIKSKSNWTNSNPNPNQIQSQIFPSNPN